MRTLSPGSRLGPYEILSPLGPGEAEGVYRARDTKKARDVALRIMPENYARDPEGLELARRDVQVLASLGHPHLAAVESLEDLGDVRVLVQELVEGESLAERLGRGAIPVDESIEIARQIAEGLEAAHEKGIVHGDLKPSKIRRTPANRIKVLDVGVGGLIGAPPPGGAGTCPLPGARAGARKPRRPAGGHLGLWGRLLRDARRETPVCRRRRARSEGLGGRARLECAPRGRAPFGRAGPAPLSSEEPSPASPGHWRCANRNRACAHRGSAGTAIS